MKNNHLLRLILSVSFALLGNGNLIGNTDGLKGLQIAFIADAHFHDVYAEFQDQSFVGLKDSVSNKYATIRTMHSQLMSTRLFNENYFALRAALDDIAGRNIKYIGLVGDFSDDGQPVHLRKLKQILDEYSQKYGFHFFAVHGNHDPNRPFDFPGGKKDFLGEGGREQSIFSKESKVCEEQIPSTDTELPVICTQEILQLGYEGIVDIMGNYGFMPQKNYLYWATPYSTYTYEAYSYEKAQKESGLHKRSYEICLQGTGGDYKSINYTNCLPVQDATYLVEPLKDLWLLAIDANVYLPERETQDDNKGSSMNFKGSGNAGYNKMISHKTHVMEWIERIASEAKEKGKTLITFSHFPTIDFYDNNAQTLSELFGSNGLDLKRMPTDETMQIIAKTGIGIHLGGHMHFNDTGTKNYGDGSFLVNIQVPSLAAFVPGYKILTVRNEKQFEIETVEIATVPQFNDLFKHYRDEFQYLTSIQSDKLWDKKILDAENYSSFTNWHLTELTKKRFLNQWPDTLKDIVLQTSGWNFLVLSQMDKGLVFNDWIALRSGNLSGLKPDILDAWNQASQRAENLIKNRGYTKEDLQQWAGIDVAIDFYRLMTADQMAEKYMDAKRLDVYEWIHQNHTNQKWEDLESDFVQYYCSRLFACLNQFYHSEPNLHFLVDFSANKIVDLNDNK